MVAVRTALDAAVEAAHAAGSVLVEWRKRGFKPHRKAGGEIVTSADRVANRKVLEVLNESLGTPQSMISEELGFSPGKESLLWVVDPLDGTKSYYEGENDVSVAIAGVHNKIPVVGVVYNPFTDELYTAAYKQGSFLNNKKISCSTKQSLDHAVLLADFNDNQTLKNALPKIVEQLRVGRTVFDLGSLGQARVAARIFDAYLKLSIRVWDAAAGHAILRESGCLVTDCFGNQLDYDTNAMIKAVEANKKPRLEFGMLAAPPQLHQELVQKVSETRKKLRV